MTGLTENPTVVGYAERILGAHPEIEEATDGISEGVSNSVGRVMGVIFADETLKDAFKGG